jgi:autotransporter adhesin
MYRSLWSAKTGVDRTTQNITVAASAGGALIDVSGTAGPRVITGVANGSVNASSSDAINGSQLYDVSNSMADALGGGSTVNNVGGAITNLDSPVTQNTSDVENMGDTLNSIATGKVGIKYFHSNSELADSRARGANAIAIGGNA